MEVEIKAETVYDNVSCDVFPTMIIFNPWIIWTIAVILGRLIE